MPGSTIAHPQMPRHESETKARETATSWGKADVAGLSRRQIAQLTHSQLAQVVRAAEFPGLPQEIEKRLELRDRETLERLAFLARRCCRNQEY